MKIAISQQLLDAYASSGKNPNYALTFLLNSLDINSASDCMALSGSFVFEGAKSELDLDAKNAQAVQMIFGSADAPLVEKLLWVAILFPEM